MAKYRVGDQVAWKMGDGNTMAGQITFVGYNQYEVKRVDGGIVTAKESVLRPATSSDMQAAIAFYTKSKAVGKDTFKPEQDLKGRWWVRNDRGTKEGPYGSQQEAKQAARDLNQGKLPGDKSKALSNLLAAGCPRELAEKTLALVKVAPSTRYLDLLRGRSKSDALEIIAKLAEKGSITASEEEALQDWVDRTIG